MKKEIDINRYLGKKLYEARHAAGISKINFAKMVGVHHTQLTKYENGTNQISLNKLVSIAEALSLDLNYFLEDIKPLEWDEKTIKDHKACLSMSNNFMKIKDKVCQKILRDLVEFLAEKV